MAVVFGIPLSKHGECSLASLLRLVAKSVTLSDGTVLTMKDYDQLEITRDESKALEFTVEYYEDISPGELHQGEDIVFTNLDVCPNYTEEEFTYVKNKNIKIRSDLCWHVIGFHGLGYWDEKREILLPDQDLLDLIAWKKELVSEGRIAPDSVCKVLKACCH